MWKRAPGDGLLQVTVGGGNDAHVGFDGAFAAQPPLVIRVNGGTTRKPWAGTCCRQVRTLIGGYFPERVFASTHWRQW